ncbi:hypothetical protein PMAA_008060 [Talaromyces marneffei ATCC 18224]|uniref:LysM domain-containing protein n=1 Tax=Talaromyces marneffei (strain ATCC 18224 / CBS 334.59 / QM 7333) TaxID=441960 RepID=B6QWF2_TALMQ|nr:hypothetical protein PMAA_008060 [Talaromyces marneffei ATCC 18224]
MATTTSVGSTQIRIAANCDEYHTVVIGDTFAVIENEDGITFTQLDEWNAAIRSNCETLDVGYVVCVGLSS